MHQEYIDAVRDFYHNLHHANLYMEIALENKKDKELFLKNARYTAMWLRGTRVAFNNLNFEANKQGIQFSMNYNNLFNLRNLDTFIEMNDNNQTNIDYLESTYQKINRVYETLNEQTLLNKKADIQNIIDEFEF
jgi:hypothetical protein